MINQIKLRGCAPDPLIHYLKALGIFRLVVEQEFDAGARAFWLGDTFVLESEKTTEELIEFFLNRYSPTPIVAPWNGGSGFYEGDDTRAIEVIRNSDALRLKEYRETVESIFSFSELPKTSDLTVGQMFRFVKQETEKLEGKKKSDLEKLAKETSDKAETAIKISASNLSQLSIKQIEEIYSQKRSDQVNKEEIGRLGDFINQAKKLRTAVKKIQRDEGKDDLARVCRNCLGERVVKWIDTVVVLSDFEAYFPPLLGSGGNDGRLDFTTNFMRHLISLLPETIEQQARKGDVSREADQNEKRLHAALFTNQMATLEHENVGQFHPAGVGGVNSGISLVNPWDFVLAIEGTLVLASATVRRLASGARSLSSFPFTAQNSTVGYSTATENENMRAEIWLPLWCRSASFAEVSHIFSEGRVQFAKTQRRTVRTGFDFARAVAELGSDRGIDAFQRYGFIERNGRAYLAASLGRFEVRERPRAALIYEVDQWLDSLRRATSNTKRTPERLSRAVSQIEEAMFDLCASGGAEPLRATLIALGAAEAEVARTANLKKNDKGNVAVRPLAGLTARWASKCDDRSFEFEIALALASITGEGKRGPFRANLEPVEISGRGIEWTNEDAGAVWGAGSLEDNLAAVLHRRSIDARAASASHPALSSKRFASLRAIDAFLRGANDDEEIESLLCGLALINWSGAQGREFSSSGNTAPTLSRAYAMLKLLFLPEGRLELLDEPIKHEPSIIPLLRAERINDALEVADRRLRSSGLVPFTNKFHVSTKEGRRIAAALLIPIDLRATEKLAALVSRPPESSNKTISRTD